MKEVHPAQSIAIRVDAGLQMGIGHFMRMLTLADALRWRGAQVRFVSRDLPPHLQRMLADRGHELAALPARPLAPAREDLAHSHWLEGGQAGDAADTGAALADRSWAWLLIDHYAIDARWERALRSRAGRLFVMDDLADRPHECDVLLDQNLYAGLERRYDGKLPGATTRLLGPKYALLREEFRRLRPATVPQPVAVRKVLVLLGGADARNHTGKVIEALARLPAPRPAADVVIGWQHPAREAVEAACRRHGFACHVQTARVAELLAAADLAVGAGGSTSWEFCCAGLPAVYLTQAENQVPIARGLAAAGAAVYLGPGDEVAAEEIRDALAMLIADPARLASLARTAYELVDGQGVDRVCTHLQSCL